MPSNTLRTPADLVDAGLIAAADEAAIAAVADRYAVAIPPAMAALIDRTDPNDPIARQFVPDPRELVQTADERADPIGDLAHSPVEGIVHRYPDRVLLKAVHVCPVYCRFLLPSRNGGPEGLGTLTTEALDRAIGYIAAHAEIWEVILTGGDPLVLSPRRLGEIMSKLAGIPHVRIVRFHTRVPGGRAGARRCGADRGAHGQRQDHLPRLPRQPSARTHPAARAAAARLVEAGIVLISQTVLLRGVNDDAEVLAELMRGFVENRIRPYYLHHPDLAPGTGHFRVSIADGQALMRRLRGRISGLCQPTYILDIPGGHGKSVIEAPSIFETADGTYEIEDFRGARHAYPPRSD